MSISNYTLFKGDSNDVFWLMWSKSVRSDFFFLILHISRFHSQEKRKQISNKSSLSVLH